MPLNKVTTKQERELAIFSRFIERSKIPVIPESVANCEPPEPDIVCELHGEGMVRFELAEACAPEFAEAINNPRAEGVYSCFGGDVSMDTVRKKLKKRYPVEEPVELLIYTDGATAKPDLLLIHDIEDASQENQGQFRRIWLMGDQVHKLTLCARK